MKPIPDFKNQARVKGGRASGGTRYYHGKSSGEDKMIRLMQRALDEKKEEQRVNEVNLADLSVDDLIAVLEFSCAQTERLLREVEKRCFQNKK
jgi:hypothetical protein